MHRAVSKTVGNTVNFKTRLAKIQQQAKPQAGCGQIIDALRGLCTVQRLAGFQFDDDGVLDEQTDDILPRDDIIIVNGKRLLLRDGKPCIAQLMRQSIFISLFQKPRPERMKNPECAANNALRQRIGPGPICVHLRASAVKDSFSRQRPHLGHCGQPAVMNHAPVKLR
jgi:hypothetical protein